MKFAMASNVTFRIIGSGAFGPELRESFAAVQPTPGDLLDV
jgi:hypothetical protein